MKKILTFAAVALMAVAAQATAIGWAAAGAELGTGNYNGQAYQFFIIGQNGVTDVAQITGMIANGDSVASYVYGDGVVANGKINVTGANSGKEIVVASDTPYTGFMVMYNATNDKFVTFAGAANQTRTLTPLLGSTSFSAGDVSDTLKGTWTNIKSAPIDVPEPTSLALIALGVAAFGLKRKHA